MVGRWWGLVASRLSAWESLAVGTKTRKVLGERLLACRESREEALPATAFGVVPTPAPPEEQMLPPLCQAHLTSCG